jgi:SPP1 family predicted phage head-tail adaptor
VKFTPGEMNERVTLQSQTTVSDGAGGSVLTWQDLATVWAHVRPRTGREMERYDRVNATSLYMFVIRWRDDIDERNRIVWRGDFYSVRFVHRQGTRPLYLELDAERGVAQ